MGQVLYRIFDFYRRYCLQYNTVVFDYVGPDWFEVLWQEAGPVLLHSDQDQEAFTHAGRRRALGATSMHGIKNYVII